MTENEISYTVIGAAIELHKALGPGLHESVYEEALALDLAEQGLSVRRQVIVPMKYKTLEFDKGFRMDMLIEGKVIVEVKSIDRLAPVHYSQLLTYLRLAEKKLGLLINFNTQVLKDEIHRVVNGL